MLRSTWDVGPLIAQGKLQVALPQWRQEAHIWAVYPSRLTTSAKVSVCVELLEARGGFGR